MLSVIRSALYRAGLDVSLLRRNEREFPHLRRTDTIGVEILADSQFQASCRMLGTTSLLDTPRLANLWNLCRQTDPFGAILEVGSYKGGSALHLSICCPERHVFACDPFSKRSFEHLDGKLDSNFREGQFSDHSEEQVRSLLKGRNATVVPGFFPASVRGMSLPKISFVHLDVDVYQATRDSLDFLFRSDLLMSRSLIVLDDYDRGAEGVNRAVAEIKEASQAFVEVPLFPGQALLVPHTYRA